jgi:hypothetical protein
LQDTSKKCPFVFSEGGIEWRDSTITILHISAVRDIATIGGTGEDRMLTKKLHPAGSKIGWVFLCGF